jgi:hypothetical protein
MSEKALVFVSCGQVTAAEIELGKGLIALVENVSGLEAYFAETVASLDGLTTNIFKNMERAAAFVTVMHHRGVVKGRRGSPDRTRASVWIEQEIAIAAFLKHTRPFDLQVAAYAQKGLSREGVRDALILNAVEFESEDQVLADFESKLMGWNLRPQRSEKPSVNVQLARKDQDIGSARHIYGLQMTLTNASAVSIPEIAYELEFPSAFVPPNRDFHPHEERKDQATATHRAFRGKQQIDLRPGKTTSINLLEYHVTEELFSKYDGRMAAIPVVVEVYGNGQLIGFDRKPFSELQKF